MTMFASALLIDRLALPSISVPSGFPFHRPIPSCSRAVIRAKVDVPDIGRLVSYVPTPLASPSSAHVSLPGVAGLLLSNTTSPHDICKADDLAASTYALSLSLTVPILRSSEPLSFAAYSLVACLTRAWRTYLRSQRRPFTLVFRNGAMQSEKLHAACDECRELHRPAAEDPEG
jgi:hypothetical protein